jgi:hypothetical protein
MKKIFAMAAFAMAIMPAAAQETYENAKISWSDLNGTARYVGMGGAMEALGGDISTIGTNPAGIGLFRKSYVSLSVGAVSQADAENFGGGKTTNISFDQLGFVYAGRNSSSSFINFGFNYHKSRNFNYILSAADGLYNASQNKQTYLKAKDDWLYENPSNPDFNSPYIQCNQLDAVYAENLLYDPTAQYTWGYYEANGYTMDRRHWGYVADYDFNLSGNVNNRVYLGLTVGIHDVHYNHMSEYIESFDQGTPIMVKDERKIKGAGADIKAGVIFRPIEYSPFRIGLSVTTPTWYDLTTSNNTYLSDGAATYTGDEYDFRLYTPWKFGLSMGTTVGDFLALGASYEYTDYGSLDTRYKTDDHYSYWTDSYTTQSESDEEMNRHTSETLKGVSTLKLGAEFKAAPEVAVRFGYNYVSPMYKKDGYKDGTLPCEGSYYSSATDWTNWEATHRITCGVGIQIDNVNLSAAYQYSAQNGWFSPFNSYSSWREPYDELYDPADDYDVHAVKLSNKRHQVLLTATINL